jgi:hypothetical protein
LLLADKYGVVKELLTSGPAGRWEFVAEPLVTRLIYRAGLTRSQALWAVENWAEILTTRTEAGSPPLPKAIRAAVRRRRQGIRKVTLQSDRARHLFLVVAGPFLILHRARALIALLLLLALCGVTLLGAPLGFREVADLKELGAAVVLGVLLCGWLYYVAQAEGVSRSSGSAGRRNPVARPPTPPRHALVSPRI